MPEGKKDGRKSNGGKREGAGRPAKLVDPVTKLVRLESDMVKKIEEQGHTVSEFLRDAGQRRLDEGW